eukprot:TRINITY_DN493_c0_g1_i7.p1 TRINITY_DN493_c0_g1~~TRINITY_DN493_c0_g1_i7.p1  ORF type:complete len:823 (-),score=148.33 TRINITY_DN493_c0_g1_i7:267-2735(-)
MKSLQRDINTLSASTKQDQDKNSKNNRYNVKEENPNKFFPQLSVSKPINKEDSARKLTKLQQGHSNQTSKVIFKQKQLLSANASLSIENPSVRQAQLIQVQSQIEHLQNSELPTNQNSQHQLQQQYQSQQQQQLQQQPGELQQGVGQGSSIKPKAKVEKPELDVFTIVQKLVNQQNQPLNFEPFYKHVNMILSKMVNWELLEEKEINLSLQTLKLILTSKICNILTEPKYIDWLIRMLDSQNIPLKIQQLALEAIQTVCKNISHKKIIIQRDILKTLFRIATSCIMEKEKDHYDKQLVIQAIKCLTLLGGIYDRRNYIPGETRENDQIRKILIEGGGLLAIIIIYKKSTQEEFKQECRLLLDNLSQSDLEYQLEIVKKFKDTQKTKDDVQIESQRVLNKNTNTNIQLQQDQANKSNNSENEKAQDGEDGNQENKVELNQTLRSAIKDFAQPIKVILEQLTSIPDCISYLNEIIHAKKQVYQTLQQKEAQKKEFEQQQSLAAELQRQKLIVERKQNFEQFLKKKEQDEKKKKQQEKLKDEQEREIQLQQEELRKKKFEEILKKREIMMKQKRIDEEIRLSRVMKEKSSKNRSKKNKNLSPLNTTGFIAEQNQGIYNQVNNSQIQNNDNSTKQSLELQNQINQGNSVDSQQRNSYNCNYQLGYLQQATSGRIFDQRANNQLSQLSESEKIEALKSVNVKLNKQNAEEQESKIKQFFYKHGKFNEMPKSQRLQSLENQPGNKSNQYEIAPNKMVITKVPQKQMFNNQYLQVYSQHLQMKRKSKSQNQKSKAQNNFNMKDAYNYLSQCSPKYAQKMAQIAQIYIDR